MFGKSWTEHIYAFTPACKPISTQEKIGNPYEIRIYKNEQGLVIWAVEIGATGFFCNDLYPQINKSSIQDFPGRFHFANQLQETSSLVWKKEWKRSYSDVRFLLSSERTREDFIKKVSEHRETWLLFPSADVESAVWEAVDKAEAGRGKPSVRGENSYSGPASLSIQELVALGCRVCHRPPTKKFPMVAPSDHVVENFNWGSRAPKRTEWFKYGAGYSYNGSCGCNSGWVWYD